MVPDLGSTPRERLTFLVGAGGSWRAGLPLAHDVVDVLLGATIASRRDACALARACRPGHAAARHPYDYLRFETVMGVVAELVDPDLTLLDFIALARDPSPLQRRLAQLAAAGARLVTVNFDDLLERALLLEGATPQTVDAHGRATPPAPGETPVLKLHGSLVRHRGGRERRVRAPLHTTLDVITARSPGLRLARAAAGRMDEATAGQVLVVVGYSAADDLDVVPTLASVRPSRVVWIDHSGGPVRAVSPSTRIANASLRALLHDLDAAGVDVRLVRGPTERALRRLGLGAIDEPGRTALPWREAIRAWAASRRGLLDRGAPLAAMLWGELERWPEKHRALLRSSGPRGRTREQPWTRARRAYEAGQTAFLGGGRGATVLRWAKRSLAYAEADGDRPSQSRALVLLGRFEAERDDRETAVALYREAMSRVDPSDVEWAEAGERCANALSFLGRHDEALALLRPVTGVLRRRGIVETLVDARHGAGMANRSLGRMRRAARAFREAEELARQFPMDQQHFAAAAMLGETLRLLGDLDAAREFLQRGVRSARRASAYPSEVAIAHHFLGRVAVDAGLPERARRHLGDARRELDAAPGSPWAHQTRVLCELHRAELDLWLGRPDAARRRLRRVVRAGDVPPGEPWATAALLEHLLDPTADTADTLDAALAGVRRAEVTVFVDLCVALSRLGTATPALDRHVRRARSLARRWGNDTLAARLS
ncbi:MAG TPA: SIR2 family protein [Solirubrobacteraceae bacterium]|jgi:tetratricopeptide (TPR) repeat protein|nr:SIR2 family protein [Solirubrobacteraceae bacterium]